MSSFLAATLATFAQPTPFKRRPSRKNRSTAGLAKLWIAIGGIVPWRGIPCQGIRSLRGDDWQGSGCRAIERRVLATPAASRTAVYPQSRPMIMGLRGMDLTPNLDRGQVPGRADDPWHGSHEGPAEPGERLTAARLL